MGCGVGVRGFVVLICDEFRAIQVEVGFRGVVRTKGKIFLLPKDCMFVSHRLRTGIC